MVVEPGLTQARVGWSILLWIKHLDKMMKVALQVAE
jgi:hypothetical protein